MSTMTLEQPSLFDRPVVTDEEAAWLDTRHARNSDPETSHQSAKEAKSFANGHALKCLNALKELGCATQSEIANRVGLLPHQVNKRLADLHSKAIIVPSGKTRAGHANRKEREWRVV